MEEDYKQKLNKAATAYREQETTSSPFPVSTKHYDLLLEKAFIEGATWYNRLLLDRKQRELAAVKIELEELQKGVTASA